ncbi:MAG: RNA methyltransferase [Lentimicrobiaceae bacterium]|nr:RNA methyltransferase [Lentimicrobiaceae bacterium]
MPEKIFSPQNPMVKNIVRLQKTKERKAQNRIVIEGYREIHLALDAGFLVEYLFVCKKITGEALPELFLPDLKEKIIEVTPAVFNKIAYREQSDGLMAIAIPKDISIHSVFLSNNPLVIVLESVEKPGNLGAILRTADAASADAVIICDPLCDIYSPNTIRSSIGCVFTQQVAVCTTEEAISWLVENKITTFAAALTGNKQYHEMDFSRATAIVMGTEAHGLSKQWIENTDYQIKIPMLGKIDSLNVSVSTAILVFEALRQRNFYQ